MPRQEHVLTVFVASPSDVAAERTRLEEVIVELNQSWSRSLGIRLDLIRWETHAYPGFGIDPQEVINRQTPDDYDIFIGIMWHRFGTATGRAESGSHEEFLRAKARWEANEASINIMAYFKDAPISPSHLDPDQLAKVVEFRKSLGNEGGLYWPFQSTDEFENLARMHLSRVVQDWQKKLPVADRSNAPASAPLVGMQPVETEGEELGLFELSEQFEDNFAEVNAILERITKSTVAIGKKMEDHSKRFERTTMAGPPARAAAKRMIEKVAKDMSDYAGKLDKDAPALGKAMMAGLGALSQAISLWPDFSGGQAQQDQMVVWRTSIAGLRDVLSIVETNITNFRHTVESFPRLTSELNKAKWSVSLALQKMADQLHTQQQVLTQSEKSAMALINVDDRQE